MKPSFPNLHPEAELPRILIVANDVGSGFDSLGANCEFECFRTDSGPLALEVIGEQSFALVLLRIQGPGADWLQTVRLLKRSSQLTGRPLLLIGDLEPEHPLILRAFSEGVSAYLAEPVHPAFLRANITSLIGLSAARRKESIQVPALSPERTDARERALDQIFTEAPSFMAYLRAPDFIFERANEKYYELIGRREILGKSVKEVLPEAEAQGFLRLLQDVVQSKKSFIGTEVAIDLYPTASRPARKVYIDFVYQPLTSSNGDTFGVAVIGYDVTEKVLSRKALERSKNAIEIERANFRNLFRQTPEMVCMLAGPEHRFEFVNDAHIRALGFDATGKTVREAQPESVEVHGILDNVYRTGLTAELREIPVTVTDRVRHFNLTYAARRGECGNVNGVMILGTEVTEEVLSRRKIREARERLELALESGQMGTWQVDLKSNLASVSGKAAAILGYESIEADAEFVMGRSIHPDDFDEARQVFNSSIADGTPYSHDYRIVRPDGEVRWIQARGHTSRAFNGEPLVASGIIMDVTERVVAAQSIAESRERYKCLYEQSPLPIWTFDIETLQFLEVNETALRHYGYTRDEFLSMAVTEIRPAPDVERFRAAMRQSYKKGDVYLHRNYQHLKKDGTVIDVEVLTQDISLNGRDARLCSVRDVTDRLKAEQDQKELMARLHAAKEEAERANHLKSAFLANMSHEIRTPLGAMIGFADLLRDPGLTEAERSNYTNILLRNGEQLSVIINDILDLSKVEAGHLTLEFGETDPDQVAADVISLLRVKAKDKDLVLEYERDDSAPPSILSDPVRVRQILMNLVGNAVKFTQFGSVKVRAFGCTSENGLKCACFEVTDSGIGIPESQWERIFEMFVQADGSMTRRFGGTGLGLALSRSLARELGGDVKVTGSEEGRGSKFLFMIEDQPHRRTSPSFVSEKTSVQIALPEKAILGVKVLVIDDAPDNQKLIWKYLTKSGATVDFADNGWEGYRKALAGDFDIVLMDIQMPVMDGYTATQKLRDHDYKKPIIALTAHAMTEVRRKCLNVGCTDYLSKPINPNDLVRTVAQHATS